MARRRQLDAAGRARSGALIRLLALLLAATAPLPAQETSDSARLVAAQRAVDAGRWEEAAHLASGPPNQPAELDFLAGFSNAHLKRWDEARGALKAGEKKAPGDPRFPTELAGVAYQQKRFADAKCELRRALRLKPGDPYGSEFLGTIFYLEDNLPAALKYWNVVEKPRLRDVLLDPTPRLQNSLVQRAMAFNAPQVLSAANLRDTEARLDNLGVFPQRRVSLAETPQGEYDATLHLTERNGWGNSALEGAVSLFSGVGYSTVYPQYFNISSSAINFTSLVRWDSEKRRVNVSLSTPLFGDPSLRLRFYVDARNENWNLTRTFFDGSEPLTDLNLRKIVAGAMLGEVENGNWSWTAGFEAANRSYRNLAGHDSAAEEPFFTGGTSAEVNFEIERALLRIPERRFTVDSVAQAAFGRGFRDPLGSYGSLRGRVRLHWLPRSEGDDYELISQLGGGVVFGEVPLDQLFQLGGERDNDLQLRGHDGSYHHRKGGAPLGRRYVLANTEWNKTLYDGALLRVQAGPILDTGTIADSSGLFGSDKWLVDAGVQAKIGILHRVTVVLSYAHDLRGGQNVFFPTVLQ